MKNLKNLPNDENEIMTNFYEINCEIYMNKLSQLLDKEPLKILRRKHKKWENEYNCILSELDNSYKKLLNSYIDIEGSINKKHIQ